MEQSHWLASNAVVNGSGKATSITDESGVANAVAYTGGSGTAFPWTYAASGWQLNGKTLPTIQVAPGGNDVAIYRADAWGTKLSGYTGTYTIAMLVTPVVAVQTQFMYGIWNSSSGTNYVRGIYAQPNSSGDWRTAMSDGSNWSQVGFSGGYQSGAKQLIMTEFTGTAGSSGNPQQQWRVWINGLLRTGYGDGNYDKVPSVNVNRFSIMGVHFTGDTARYCWEGTQLAQFHIWKGALTDTQRNDITAYLKSISGIA
jgi:hypothetical protein